MLNAVVLLTTAAALLAVCMLVLSLSSPRPSNLGVKDGRLAACPPSPNCVSTQAEDRDHWIQPIDADHDQALSVILEIVRRMPRVTIVATTNNYIHAEFRSRLFRFCDDVEFFLDPESNRIHFRSASRLGHSDLGVNRARMEHIREQFLRTVEHFETNFSAHRHEDAVAVG